MIYASQIHYPINVAAIKTSIILFYFRLFRTRYTFRKILYVTQILVAAWCIITIFLAIFHCMPIYYAWTPNLGEIKSHCSDINAYLVSTSVVNVLFDFWILALPLSVVWRLQLSRRRKMGLSGIFMLGLLYVGSGNR